MGRKVSIKITRGRFATETLQFDEEISNTSYYSNSNENNSIDKEEPSSQELDKSNCTQKFIKAMKNAMHINITTKKYGSKLLPSKIQIPLIMKTRLDKIQSRNNQLF